MRVLQLISSGGHYGAETVLLNLSKSLGAMGCDTSVGIFMNMHRLNVEFAGIAEAQGLRVEKIPCRGRLDWGAVRTIRNLIKAGNIDLIHTHGYKSDFYGYAAARSIPIPRVATCHLWTRKTAVVRLYEALDRVILPRFDRVIGVSESISALIRNAGVASDKVHTIDNGIDITPFSAAEPTLTEARARGGKVIGAIGRLEAQKGLEYFLRAARNILKEFPDTTFVIVGDGPEREKLEAIANDLGIASHVMFTGQRRDMPGIHASLDIFALSSIDEGMPIVILEAMAASTPIVATSVGAVPKLIASGKTGLLVEPRDPEALSQAIITLLKDPQLAKKLGQNARTAVAENNSAEAMARKYFELYSRVLSSAKGRSHDAAATVAAGGSVEASG
jgi:glycosyltransferase involved in cell wall biosynthesis